MIITISEEVQFDNGEGGFSRPFTERVTFTISGNTIEELAIDFNKQSQALNYQVESFEFEDEDEAEKVILALFNREINK